MSKPIEISLVSLKTIYDAVLPIYYKLNSFLEDAIRKNIAISELERSTLLEYTSCCSSLKIIFENYFEIAKINNLKQIALPESEYLAILSMAKTVEMSARMPIAGSGIWEH